MASTADVLPRKRRAARIRRSAAVAISRTLAITGARKSFPDIEQSAASMARGRGTRASASCSQSQPGVIGCNPAYSGMLFHQSNSGILQLKAAA